MLNKPRKKVAIESRLIVTRKDGVPCVELRASFRNLKLVKEIVSHGLYGKPIILVPVIRDPAFFLNRLLETGIAYYDAEKNEYFFTI